MSIATYQKNKGRSVMKKALVILCAMIGLLSAANFKKGDFSDYLSHFDYKERGDMKIKMDEMFKLVKEGKAILLDIRFKEEAAVWSINFAKNIPLNELPSRLNELPKDKLIITACPHYDRSSMARHYLTLNGYQARYLTDGLLKVVDALRGDKAIAFANIKK